MFRAKTASTIAVLPPTWRYTVAREHPAARATSSRLSRSNPWRAICVAATVTMRSAAMTRRSPPCSQSEYGDIARRIYRKMRQNTVKFSPFTLVGKAS
ncbi:hypothetical protein [Mycobacteroides franklinii]|uniref:hypothetical protein n=1 Tax=Mycobacteroides franklinii TaxID=948102 RepID=UPI001F1C9749|nr:hypothetical protein [Mycobacteroides franklinii]